MTVGNIREGPQEDYIEVIFHESARFFRLLKTNSNFDDFLKRLREAMKQGRVLDIGIASVDSDLIEDVV